MVTLPPSKSKWDSSLGSQRLFTPFAVTSQTGHVQLSELFEYELSLVQLSCRTSVVTCTRKQRRSGGKLLATLAKSDLLPTGPQLVYNFGVLHCVSGSPLTNTLPMI